MTEFLLTATALGHAHTAERWLFRGLDLQLGAGEVLAVLAPNGRGKSTLLSTLAGLLKPREGRVRVAGLRAFVPAAAPIAFDYAALDVLLWAVRVMWGPSPSLRRQTSGRPATPFRA